jgi:hypothetical protein
MPAKILGRLEQTAITSMLEDDNTAIQKRGLQRLSNQLQSGKKIPNPRQIESRLVNLRWSADARVRSWLYNTLARLRTRNFRDYLSYQILFNEDHAENLTWAVAAFFASALPDEIDDLISQPALDFFNSPLELAAQLYYDGEIASRLDKKPFEHEMTYNPIFAKWYALLFGYDRTDKRIKEFKFPHIEMVADLNHHHDDEVVEYSIWALCMSRAGGLKHCALRPEQAIAKNPSVRRWFYRLLAKDDVDVFANLDFLRARIANEKDAFAREGLAIALANQYAPEISDLMLGWFLAEDDRLVRMALAPHFPTFADRNAEYEEYVALRLSEGTNSIEDRLISATTAQEKPTQALSRIVAQNEQKRDAQKVVIAINGGVHMTNESKTVTNIAHGGNVVFGTINMGTIDSSPLEAIARLNSGSSHDAKLGSALERYAHAIANDTVVAPAEKAALNEAVKDLTKLAEQRPEERHKFGQRAIATIKGIASSMPTAANLLHETNELIEEISQLL